MLVISFLLIVSEFSRWWRGHEIHTFAVDKVVGNHLQINLDIVVPMRCTDIHINVQDAAGDRVLAGTMLKKEITNWHQWADISGVHKLGTDSQGRVVTGEGFHEHEEGFGEEHVHDIVAAAAGRKSFAKTPKLSGRGKKGDSCRIFGSLGVNKVQGDFHITARGHGYQELGSQHLDHVGKLLLSRSPIPRQILSSHSVQLLSHHLRALFRRFLPVPPQPPRPHRLHNSQPFPQIPVLPLRRSHCIHHRLLCTMGPTHAIYKPIRRN